MPQLPKTSKLILKIRQAPCKPGVYWFKDKNGNILYIGKAISLKNRLRAYLAFEKNNPKTQKFLLLAQNVNWLTVKSDIEAILLEMNLIKQIKPPFNIIWKDDKQPLYITFSKEKLPRVRISRKENIKKLSYYGPFASARKLREILKSLRKIFPFCSCHRTKTSCLYASIGLCQPSPPVIKTESEVRAYKKQIKSLKLFLAGKIKQVLIRLKREMKKASQQKNYELAGKIRDQINSINYLLGLKPQIKNYLTNSALSLEISKNRLLVLKKILGYSNLNRIEVYDVANLFGAQATASMAVAVKGHIDKSQYRRFAIKNFTQANDPAMISQAITRRLQHKEWPKPNLIVVDGGKSQVSTVLKTLNKLSINITIIGLAKKQEEIIFHKKGAWQTLQLPKNNPGLLLLINLRNEAHRFANNYHRLLRKKTLTKMG